VYDHVQKCFLASDETEGVDLIPSCTLEELKKIKPFGYGFNANGNLSYYWVAGIYLFRHRNGLIDVWDRTTNLYLATITSSNARACRPAYSSKHKRFITGNVFSNSFGFFKLDTLTDDGSVAKGSVDTGEIGTRDLVANDDVAMAMATSNDGTNQKRLHVVNMDTKAYVGYYDLPANALGNFTALGYASHFMCKNQIEYWV
jgi:hypothetical protein